VNLVVRVEDTIQLPLSDILVKVIPTNFTKPVPKALDWCVIGAGDTDRGGVDFLIDVGCPGRSESLWHGFRN